MLVSSYIRRGIMNFDPNPGSKTYFQNGWIVSIDSITFDSR
jgi:hypothetical protein